jgi:membrane protease YdiL (CAAX protease family)
VPRMVVFQNMLICSCARVGWTVRAWERELDDVARLLGAHLPRGLWHAGLSEVVFANAFGVFALTLVLGWFYLRSASILPPICTHAACNLFALQWVASRGG